MKSQGMVDTTSPIDSTSKIIDGLLGEKIYKAHIELIRKIQFSEFLPKLQKVNLNELHE